MNLLDSVQGNSLFSVTFFLFSCPQRSSYVSDKEKKLNHKAIKKNPTIFNTYAYLMLAAAQFSMISLSDSSGRKTDALKHQLPDN